MNPSAIQAIGDIAGLSAEPAAQVRQAATQGDFGNMVTTGLQQLNGQLVSTQTSLQQLAVGDVQNLHQVMIGLEEASLSFQLMMQVRGKLMEAYQEIMRMQI